MIPPSFRTGFFIAAGALAVGLGVVGIFIPVLPTTPFLLLAAACFVRSSPRLYHWLIHHRWFGATIRNYRDHHGITLRAKLFTLIVLWGGIGATVIFAVTNWWVRGALGVIAVGVTSHLLYLKTLPPERLSSGRNAVKEVISNESERGV
ncbi:MAG TPA: YbaN family protein [Anaerolineae bacterium]|nr:YbaN family protein [Anaerolineae bacterium]